MTLGSTISKLKYKTRNQTSGVYDIQTVIDRLEGFRKYKKQIQKERYHNIRKSEAKIKRKLKKATYQKMYSSKPVINPYVQMYKKMVPGYDPKLLERYQSKHLYSIYEFRHLMLPRSGYQIPAGKAWHGLIKSWNAFKIAKSKDDLQGMKRYGTATQKFAYLLEAPLMPHFPDIGLPSFDFKFDVLQKY